MQRRWSSERWRHKVDRLGCQTPPRLARLPTGPQQIMRLPHFDLHMLSPGQPRIQNNPQILDRPQETQFNPKKCGSQNPWSFLSLVNVTSPVLSGLTDSPNSLHRISTVERIHCMSPDTVFGNLPTARRHVIRVSLNEYHTFTDSGE
jgi:hypothetical protein